MRSKSDWQNLLTRTLVGAVFILLVIACTIFSQWLMAVLFYIFAMIALRECMHMVNKQPGLIPRYTAAYLVGSVIYLAIVLVAFGICHASCLWYITPFVVLMFCADLIYRERYSLTYLGVTIAGWVYVVIPFALISVLSTLQGNYHYSLPLGFFAILWTNDSFAYITGRFLGRHKLYEKISPNKTWEGLVGGIAFAMGAAWICSQLSDALEMNQWFVVASIISVFATLGDLFESLIKRGIGIKDSGKLLPGHGGVLDRFDGLLLSMPIVIFYLEIFVFA